MDKHNILGSDWFKVCALLVGGLIFLVSYFRYAQLVSRELFTEWAQQNKYQILEARRLWIVPIWESGRGCRFFQLKLKTESGKERQCWVCCDLWKKKNNVRAIREIETA
jgi:hypothetical protein